MTSTPVSISCERVMLDTELNTTDASVFEQEVQHKIVDSGEPHSLLILDMNETSELLGRSGRTAKLKFQRAVADSLLEVCREQDRVYRIGDNIFGMLLAGVTSPIHQQLAAEKITRLHNDAIRGLDVPFNVAMSIGIANFPEHAVGAIDLILNAKIALEASHTSGDPYFIYLPDTVATLSLKWDLQKEVGSAIKNKEFELHYQPKISIKTGRVVGAEALLRWNSEKNGSVPPDVFIPVACDIGMMNELSQFVLTTALRQAAEWPDMGERCSVSVNVEADALQAIDLANVVNSGLSIWGTENCDLILEITETALVEESRSNFRCLKKLRAMGVGISIDDFGTGYSSLSYFKNIPATELKIDKSFVANMLDSEKDKNLVEAIIWLAHRFELSVVAEGVETVEQFQVLEKLGCDVIQGYYYSKPLSQEEFSDWIIARETGSV